MMLKNYYKENSNSLVSSIVLDTRGLSLLNIDVINEIIFLLIITYAVLVA